LNAARDEAVMDVEAGDDTFCEHKSKKVPMTCVVIAASLPDPEERWAVFRANNLVQTRPARGVSFISAPSRATRSNGEGHIRLGFPRDKQYKTLGAQPTVAADSS